MVAKTLGIVAIIGLFIRFPHLVALHHHTTGRVLGEIIVADLVRILAHHTIVDEQGKLTASS